VRAVLDANVIISALLSPGGSPARTLVAWSAGRYELIGSKNLLDELARALAYPKLRRRVPPDEAERVVRWLWRDATIRPDPDGVPAIRSVDPGDDYLILLASAERAVLVTGDDHLLRLRSLIPVASPAEFLARLDA
jgi:putative PIN family toxin of toxin-antitoxin system